ncbi:MAG: hypothetical protein JKY04_03330 [Sneathiella sp.]|nr:hypothetical protein [Sneathiella sp.]MBL4898730.1 hypothetical protein [Colwellia sp.]
MPNNFSNETELLKRVRDLIQEGLIKGNTQEAQNELEEIAKQSAILALRIKYGDNSKDLESDIESCKESTSSVADFIACVENKMDGRKKKQKQKRKP